MNQLSDEELFRLFKDGQKTAFDKLVLRYKDKLYTLYDKWEPEQYNEWLKVLRRILKKTNKDSFSYQNIYEGEGRNSYMLLDPRKIKSLFAKDFDRSSHILTKYKGGLLVQPRRDYTRIRGI